MTYQALARKYRPQSFRDIIGQEAVVRTLQNAIEQNRIHHAYLFSGVRGVGKTTSARIFAKALNCAKGPGKEPCNECTICREITEGIDLDVREIDAATYSKAEDVRDLREMMQFQPTRDRKRVFIIDEVHSLSQQAWNALLKQIEEPPPHVIFMMATTEMQKVPATILSRVQQLALRKITPSEVASRLEEICASESIEAEREALEMIARRGEGSARDALSLLDQVIAFGGRSIRAADVSAILGLADSRLFARLADAIARGDQRQILELLEDASAGGRDFKLLYRDFLSFLRSALLQATGANEALLPADPEEREAVRETASLFSYTDLLRILNALLQDDELVSRSEYQRLAVEISILKAATFPRLKAIESAMTGGGAQTRQESRPQSAASPSPSQPPRSIKTEPASSPCPQREEPEPSQPVAGDIGRFVAAVSSRRKLMGISLQNVKTSSIEGDMIVLEFDPANSHDADYLNEKDQLQFLGDLASEVFGKPMRLRITAAAPAPTAPAAKAAAGSGRNGVIDDPVLKSFQKHLGGEIVAPRSK